MKEARLLDGVLTVLAEQGVGALSVRSVAAAAGVSPAQVQYYYRTKNELVRAGFDYAGEQFLADVEAAGPGTLTDVVKQWLPSTIGANAVRLFGLLMQPSRLSTLNWLQPRRSSTARFANGSSARNSPNFKPRRFSR